MPEGICCQDRSTGANRCQCSSNFVGSQCDRLRTGIRRNKGETSDASNSTQMVAIVGAVLLVSAVVALTVMFAKYNKREYDRVSNNASRRNTKQVDRHGSKAPPSPPPLQRKSFLVHAHGQLSPRSTLNSARSSCRPNLLTPETSFYFTPRESSVNDLL